LRHGGPAVKLRAMGNRVLWGLLLTVLGTLLCACRGGSPGPSSLGAPDGTVPVVTPDGAGVLPMAELSIETPIDAATIPRGTIVSSAWVARVDVRVRAVGIARVRYEIAGVVVEADAAPFDAALHVATDGDHTLVATGYDGAGAMVAMDSVSVTVTPPVDTSCHARLDALGLDWEVATATRGIADPVWVEPLIAGVAYRYFESADPTRLLADCELAARLSALSELVAGSGLDEVVHMGIYNYRCIGGGDPSTGCTLSQHALARALDIHAVRERATGRYFNVEFDWVIDRSGDVCPGNAMTEADIALHEMACSMWSDRIFEIVLTPNFNDAHRNHFHVDITDGSMTIRSSVSGVDPRVPGLGH